MRLSSWLECDIVSCLNLPNAYKLPEFSCILYTIHNKLLLVHLRYDRHDIFDVGREAPPRRTSRFRQENKNKLISPERRWQVELETNLREVWSFTITSWLKAPTTMGWCLFSVYHSDDRFLNVEPVVATFNFMIMKLQTSRKFVSSSSGQAAAGTETMGEWHL